MSLFACTHICVSLAYTVPEEVRRVSDSLKPELRAVTSCHAVAGN